MLLKFIRGIFKTLWKIVSWTRILVLNLLFLSLMAILILSIAEVPDIQIANNSALVITPSGALVDQSSYNPSLLDALEGGPERPPETLVRDIILSIKEARNDHEITGLIFNLNHLQQAGISKIEEIGQAINRFKESGKPVIAFADSLSQQQFLLASYANEIYINPMGGVYLTGFGVYRNYYKSAAEKLRMKFHVFRVGSYKDAVEPFIRDNMSEPSREHITTWLDQLWQRYVGTIEAHRDLPKGSFNSLVNQLDQRLEQFNGNAAQLALDNQLVDGVLSRGELKRQLQQRFGENADGDGVNTISMQAYINNPLREKKKSANKIGLIVARGNILDGHQPEGRIGADTLSELIRMARDDNDLRAIVLRVDSGGGSAFASEVIREELATTRAQGMPIYISMGSVAASGGYWISTSAEEIWATPTTLTGSIGVFGLIPNVSESLAKIGIYSDGVGTSPIADAYHIDRPMSAEAQRLIQSNINNIYDRFIKLVANARRTDPQSINKIAQGRVWSGESALQLGLVDQLGSLDDLFQHIADNLDLHDWSVEEITRPLSPKEQFMRKIMEQASTWSPGVTQHFNDELNLIRHLQSKTSLTQDMQLFIKPFNGKQPQSYAHCSECIAP